jgi:hypothetical protein
MTELGPAGFLKTVLYLVAFYYLGKFLFKWWLKRKINSHAQKMNSTVDQDQAERIKKDEGHVSIKRKQDQTNSKGSQSSGDYVDFEEVE